MAVSNTYIVQYLSQEAASSGGGSMVWREREGGGYVTWLHGVRIELFGAPSSTGTRYYLAFCRGEDRVFIEEPQSTAVFSRKYRDENDRQLVESLQSLLRSVSRQCAARRARAQESRERVREEIFQQVLFGGGPEPT